MTIAAPSSPEAWDEDIARELVGCLVLVGITYRFPDGSLGAQQQLFGYVRTADPERGIELRLAGNYAGKTYRLPPDTRVFRSVPSGQYRLKATGEVVSDPDYSCAWTINAPTQ